jgi:hypothetical protein
MVGLASLPMQVSPASADACMVVGGNGSSFLINDGGDTARSWLINIEGMTYRSDSFDKLTKVKRSVKVAGKKKKVKEVVFTFKDKQGITRTNAGGLLSAEVTIKGEINEHLDNAFVTIKDRSAGREYLIYHPAAAPHLNGGYARWWGLGGPRRGMGPPF